MDNIMLYLTAAIFAVVGVIWCAQITPAVRLSVAAFLAVPQFFVPGVPASLFEAWVALMAVMAFGDRRVRVGRPLFVAPVFVLACTYAVAQFWSESPFSQSNLLIIFRLICFAVLACYALSVAANDPKNLIRSFRWAVPWIIVQAALTIAFKFSPALEAQFLSSSLANVLVGPSAAGLFNGFLNNVLDPVKAGGLYVNANVASMFFGVAFFLLLAAIRSGASRWYRLWAVIAWVAVWATGSKTGAAIAIALPITAYFIPRIARGKGRLMLVVIALVMVPAVIGLPDFIASIAPEYADNSEASLGSRGVLWEAASVLFDQAPWLGLGFGGWAANIGPLLGFNNLPPHNMIIAAWANAGLLAGAAVVGFVAVTTASFVKRILTTAGSSTRKILTYALCALAWIFIHGLGDNTTFYGETRTAFFAAIALAYWHAGRVEPDVTLDPMLDLKISTAAAAPAQYGRYSRRRRADQQPRKSLSPLEIPRVFK